MLDGGEFHQVPHLAVMVPLGRILRLWQRLQEDCGRCDVLARTELLRELHAGIVEAIVVDPECALLTFTNAPDLYTASARFVVYFPLEYSPKVYQSVDRQ